MKQHKTKHPIFTPYFIEIILGTAHTGRALWRFAPRKTKRVIHNIYSCNPLNLGNGYQGYYQLGCQ